MTRTYETRTERIQGVEVAFTIDADASDVMVCYSFDIIQGDGLISDGGRIDDTGDIESVYRRAIADANELMGSYD